MKQFEDWYDLRFGIYDLRFWTIVPETKWSGICDLLFAIVCLPCFVFPGARFFRSTILRPDLDRSRNSGGATFFRI